MSYSSLIITFLLDSLHKVQKKLRKKIRFAVRSQPMKPPSHFIEFLVNLFAFPFPSLLLASPLTLSLQFLSSLLSFPCFSSPLFQSNHFLSSLHISFLPFSSFLISSLPFSSLLCAVWPLTLHPLCFTHHCLLVCRAAYST